MKNKQKFWRNDSRVRFVVVNKPLFMSGGKEYVVRNAVSEKQSHGYAHLCLLFRQVNDRLNFLVYNAISA